MLKEYMDYITENRALIIQSLALLEDVYVSKSFVEKVLSGEDVSQGDYYDVEVVLNLWDALVFAFEHPVEFSPAGFVGDDSLSDFYEEIQGQVTDGLTADMTQSGIFRLKAPSISGTSYKPVDYETYGQVRSAFLSVVREFGHALMDARMSRGKVLVAFEYYARLCKAQFFFDGNKRSAYILVLSLLCSMGINWIILPPSKSGMDSFLDLLKNVYESEVGSDNEDYHLNVFAKHMARYYATKVDFGYL